jgi:ribosomal protein S18 acetylase RimI-like enzyme
MDKTVKMRNGQQVTIRPLTIDDSGKSFAFFQALPPEDRAFLRVDVTQRHLVEARIRLMDEQKVKRLVAVHNGDIVADGALELEPDGWKQHFGEIRLIVAHHLQRQGLGTLMAHELFSVAQGEKVEELVVKLMRPQEGAHRIFRKLGFHEEATLPKYVKDVSGHKQDLIVMRCVLDHIWQEWEHQVTGFDWSRF